MENNNRKLLRFKDAIIIVLLLGVALGAYLLLSNASSDANSSFALISLDGSLVGRIPLNENGSRQYPEIPNMVFTVSEGGICVSESGCGDRICVRTGKISHSGEAIICVPNRVAVTVESDAENDVDVVLR